VVRHGFAGTDEKSGWALGIIDAGESATAAGGAVDRPVVERIRRLLGRVI